MYGSVGQTKLTAKCFQEQFLPGYMHVTTSFFFPMENIGTPSLPPVMNIT